MAATTVQVPLPTQPRRPRSPRRVDSEVSIDDADAASLCCEIEKVEGFEGVVIAVD